MLYLALLASLLLFVLGVIASLLPLPSRTCRSLGLWSACAGSLVGVLVGVAAITGELGASRPLLGALDLSPYVGLDALSGLFVLALSLVGLAASLYSLAYVAGYEHEGYRGGRFAFLLNLFLLSVLAVFVAQHALVFLVAWEGMALSSYFLVTFEHRQERAGEAGFLYLLMTHAGTAALVVMFLVLGGTAGSLSFSAFAGVPLAGPLRDAVFLLALAGFGVKAGVLPLHAWLPQAHPQAPSSVSALMSGVMIKTGIYGLVRVLFGFLAVGSHAVPEWWGVLLLALGLASTVLGVLYALMERDLKRLLAYSSIENIGIILLGLGAAVLFAAWSQPVLAGIALFAALFHALNHALFKGLLFLAAGSVAHGTRTRDLERMGGLVRAMPATALLFFAGAASISALPPLNGFASEWFTFQALLGGVGGASGGAGNLGFLLLAAAVITLALAGALALAAFVKAFGMLFLGLPRSEDAAQAHESPRLMRAGMALLGVACVVVGAFPSLALALVVPAVGASAGGPASPLLPSAPQVWGLAGQLPSTAILLVLLAGGLVYAMLARGWGRRTEVRDTWDCGIPQVTPSMQYSAAGLAMPLLRVFSRWASPLSRAGAEGPRLFDALFYRPLLRVFLAVAPWSRKLQTGRLVEYLFYLIVTLAAVVTYAKL